MRRIELNRERGRVPGGMILAMNHLGNVDPFVMSCLYHRQIHWLARIEFYRFLVFKWFLDSTGNIPINRTGVPIKAIRRAIAWLGQGSIVGIFPEGGVAVAKMSMLFGGPFKRGACTIALRSGAPIVPVVMVGTQMMNAVKPWLPFRRARLYVNYGEPIFPGKLDGRASHRRMRLELAKQLAAAYVKMFQELEQAAPECRQYMR